jgi:hypothetical protein
MSCLDEVIYAFAVSYLVFRTVDSNDSLYGGHAAFLNRANEMASGILEDLLVMLKELGELKLHQRQVSSYTSIPLFQDLL